MTELTKLFNNTDIEIQYKYVVVYKTNKNNIQKLSNTLQRLCNEQYKIECKD